MQRRRVSSGLNWNPHFMVCAGFSDVSREEDEPSFGVDSVYPISVGTLSLVIPVVRELPETRVFPALFLRTVSAGPCLDDVYVVWGRGVDSSHAY
jgi:hypothetical protein